MITAADSGRDQPRRGGGRSLGELLADCRAEGAQEITFEHLRRRPFEQGKDSLKHFRSGHKKAPQEKPAGPGKG